MRTLTKLAVALVVVMSASACGSQLQLSPESRLPKWFSTYADRRESVKVSMDTFVGPFGRTATFTLRSRNGSVLSKASGKKRGLEPIAPNGDHTYPLYEIVTVGEIVELIEHRRMDNSFFVSDDVQLKRQLGVP